MRLHPFPVLISILFSLFAEGFAQSKMDLQLLRLVREREMSIEAVGNKAPMRESQLLTVIAILKKDMALPQEALDEMGVTVGNQVGRVVSLRIPIDQLENLAQMSWLESLNANRKHQVNCLNARIETGVNVLHGEDSFDSGQFPQTYSGKGVVLGVIDTGIEYNHLNFKDETTNQSRVKTAVLYRPFEGEIDSIREVYTEPYQIDTLTTDYNKMGHGTHTTGVAAGSYQGFQQQGMAPEADLILCGTSVLEDDRLIDALQTTFAQAEAFGQPCVVNLSIGSPVDWKDGKTPLCLACEALTEGGEAPGRAIVFSAGNDGNKSFSAQIQLQDTLPVYTLLEPYVKNNHSWYYNPNVVVYSSDSLPLQLDYLLYDTILHVFSELPFEQHLLDTLDAGHDLRRNLIVDCDTCDMGPWNNQLIAARIQGNPGTAVDVYYVNKESVGYAMMAGGDGEEWFSGSSCLSISDLCCTDAVISVGAYSNMDSLTNIFGRPIRPTSPRNEISKFSSYGRTSQGTPKPDIVAPGDYLVSSYSSFHEDRISYYYTSGRYLNSPMMYALTPQTDGPTYYWTADVGTSMSSPCVAGIIALWMEACPTLSVRQIREILRETSRFDAYCQQSKGGSLQAGFGKIDAVEGMRKVLETMPILTLKEERQIHSYSYDLYGHKVHPSALSKGIIIKAGKKIMIE